jgi:hypothetical protein
LQAVMERRALHNVPISNLSAKVAILNAYLNYGTVMEISIAWTKMMSLQATASVEKSAVSKNIFDYANRVQQRTYSTASV